MTSLQCTVNSCGNNKEGCCCRPDIKVGGQQAHTSSETCCDSYISKKNSMTSSIGYSQPNASLDIRCDACNCIYNENHQCYASGISVNSVASGTECSTFCEA